MRRNVVLWLIWGTALVPLLTAVLAYNGGVALTDGRTNRGELLIPVRTLEQWGGDAQRYTGHWTLLLNGEVDCSHCIQSLSRLKAVHEALGRDAGRVRIAVEPQQHALLGEGVWVVDPLGNLVLHYDARQSGEDLLHDMKRLLRVSGLG